MDGEGVAGVECSKGRLEWTHLTICAIPDNFWNMCPIEPAARFLPVCMSFYNNVNVLLYGSDNQGTLASR